ncbi:MAG: TPM domain-containing protein [Duncaniella sp.]|nr:TPM domain-containing protein [Duncaniella sp.]
MKARIFTLTIIMVITVALCHAITVEEVPNVHVKNKYEYVSNPSGILSSQAVSNLNHTIRQLWESTSVELVVVAVDQVDPDMTPEEFATRLFEKWGIGKKDNDNGILVLVARDDRAAIIRTGYGMEGVIPDIIAGRIIRNVMFPDFREGLYDNGTIAGVDALVKVIEDPQYAEELKSKYGNDSHRASENDLTAGEFVTYYLWFALFIAIVMLIDVIYAILSTSKLDEVQRYRALDAHKTAALFVAFLSCGIGIIPYLILKRKMHSIRRHKRACPNCQTQMELIDEEHDNDYLTPAQDTEEKINSIDYDVWHCPHCHETEVLPYVNRETNYTTCPQCGARAMSLVDRRTLRQSSVNYEGEGADIYVCKNCGNQHHKKFRIPKKADPAAAAAAGAVLGSMLGGSGGGGGGFSGGSFGGGMTGGGGAGGRW